MRPFHWVYSSVLAVLWQVRAYFLFFRNTFFSDWIWVSSFLNYCPSTNMRYYIYKLTHLKLLSQAKRGIFYLVRAKPWWFDRDRSRSLHLLFCNHIPIFVIPIFTEERSIDQFWSLVAGGNPLFLRRSFPCIYVSLSNVLPEVSYCLLAIDIRSWLFLFSSMNFPFAKFSFLYKLSGW